MVMYLTNENVAEVVKQVDTAWEKAIRHSYKRRKQLTRKQWRGINKSFEYEFRVAKENFWDVYCYIKGHSKHCWVRPQVETLKSYRYLTVYAFL